MAKARVLLAHENADCRKIYGSVLVFEGYDVEVVSDGDTGLRLLASLPFDIVVSDLYLSSTTDECFLRLVRANAFSAHLPVVVITGWATEPHRLLALEEGADSFLALPIRPRELAHVVAGFLTEPPAPLSLALTSERHDATVANGL
jgi:DNA-binding response OmpR family regulator